MRPERIRDEAVQFYKGFESRFLGTSRVGAEPPDNTEAALLCAEAAIAETLHNTGRDNLVVLQGPLGWLTVTPLLALEESPGIKVRHSISVKRQDNEEDAKFYGTGDRTVCTLLSVHTNDLPDLGSLTEGEQPISLAFLHYYASSTENEPCEFPREHPITNVNERHDVYGRGVKVTFSPAGTLLGCDSIGFHGDSNVFRNKGATATSITESLSYVKAAGWWSADGIIEDKPKFVYEPVVSWD